MNERESTQLDKVSGIFSSRDRFRKDDNFEPNLKVVYNSFRKKYFIPMQSKFIKRFYHTLIDLSPAEWQPPIKGNFLILKGLCDINYSLQIFFQANLKYILRNYGRTLTTNVHGGIISSYEKVIKNLVMEKLRDLDEANIGLLERIKEMPDEISKLIKLYLAGSDITSSVNCELSVSFKRLDLDTDSNVISSELMIFHDLYKALYTEQSQKRITLKNQIELNKSAELKESKKAQNERIRVILDMKDDRTALLRRKQDQKKERAKLETDDERIDRKKLQDLDAISRQSNIFLHKASKDEELTNHLVDIEHKRNIMKHHSDESSYIKSEMSLLELIAKKTQLEEQIKNLAAEAEAKIEEIRIENIGKRIKSENIINYERQKQLLEMLPTLIEKANLHRQAIEHLNVMQLASTNSSDDSQGMGIPAAGNQMVDLVHSIHLIKQILNFLEKK